MGIRGLTFRKTVPGGLRLTIRLTPKAGRDAVTGVKARADGQSELCISVTAVPEKGRANEALLRLLAEQLRLPARDLTLVSGETDRHKQVLIAGEPAALETLIAARLPAGLTDKE